MTRIQRKIPKKKRTPQARGKKKPHFRPFPLIAMKRGKSATHARIPRLKFGKHKTRSRDEKRAKKKFLRYS
jgi:hypothetical protein